jgi:hypothetical protein
MGNAASFPHDPSCVFGCYLLSLSRLLHKGQDIWLCYWPHVVVERERIKMTLFRNEFYFYICMCLAVSSTHARPSKGEIWPEIISKPNFLADAVHILYTIRIIFFEKSYKFCFFFNRERKFCHQLQWYGDVTLAIPENFPLPLIRTLITAT